MNRPKYYATRSRKKHVAWPEQMLLPFMSPDPEGCVIPAPPEKVG